MPEHYDKLVAEPDREDSDDLSDEEIARSVPAESPAIIAQAIRKFEGYQVVGHDFRRRGETTYWRTTLQSPEGGSEVLVFRPFWLKG